jgi:hypothetical protein
MIKERWNAEDDAFFHQKTSNIPLILLPMQGERGRA